MAKRTKSGGSSMKKPCRDYKQCAHKKHGWGKKRRHEVMAQRDGWKSPNAG